MTQLEGYVDHFEPPNTIGGWARKSSEPDSKIDIEVIVDDEVVGSALACDFRGDLNQECGFTVHLSQAVSIEDMHSGKVRIVAKCGDDTLDIPLWTTLALAG